MKLLTYVRKRLLCFGTLRGRFRPAVKTRVYTEERALTPATYLLVKPAGKVLAVSLN